MFCPSCGEATDPDARFCDRCGVDLSKARGPASNDPGSDPSPPARTAVRSAPLVFAPLRPRAWWYPIGVWVILSAFFLFLDVATDRGIDWSYWPIGILAIFMVGFPLLNLLEAWTTRLRAKR